MDVVIIGGGVNGLITARELVQAGYGVTLLERGEVGREASWAGGGIVSPLYPWRYSLPVTALALQAQAAYPALAQALLAETGIDPELYPYGMLMLDADDERDARAWADMNHCRVDALPATVLRERFPGLAAHWRQGLWMPYIANIRNPRLLQALLADLVRRDVTVKTGAEVARWEIRAGNVQVAITTDGQRYTGDAFVVCGGAWSGALMAQTRAAGLPLRPVRGQMLLYRLAPGALSTIVLAEGRYVIPRRDGHILCGSTLEETGFDKSTTQEAFASLAASAQRLWPALATQQPVAQWAGLRPAAPNGIPFIGRVPELENLWLNTGQFRNGLVLAPASAMLLRCLMQGQTPTIDARPYQIPVGGPLPSILV